MALLQVRKARVAEAKGLVSVSTFPVPTPRKSLATLDQGASARDAPPNDTTWSVRRIVQREATHGPALICHGCEGPEIDFLCSSQWKEVTRYG